MSSFKRVLSIGKDKKQPQPEHDPEALKRSISRPHNLAPKPVIDEWAKATKKARIDAKECERDVTTGGQPTAQPTPARSETTTKAPAMNYKPLLNVIFVDPTKPLPPTPIPSPIDGKNGLAAGGNNFITVAVARKSAASSWCCSGPDPEDPTDQAIMQPLEEEENKLIAQALPGGAIWYFRNEEEKSQAIRVLATLRESIYRYSGEVTVPKCGRECEQCLQKILARRNAMVTCEETVDSDEETVAGDEDGVGCPSQLEETVSQVVVFVTEASKDEKAPRLSLVDVDSSFADELDAQLNIWEASKEF